ncbi:MAG: glutathione S-transferase family protein [Woeseiaceae bacterium]|nr:glutathione S-transferase family protein [Woeseiaceae bacterium]
MKLYDCTTAPSARRVRMFLAEKNVELPLQQVNLRDGEQLGDAFRKINPECTVPVLQLDDGTAISEVFAICQFLESEYPEPPLLGRSAVERAIVTMWNTKAEQNGLAAVAEVLRNSVKGMRDRALPGPVNLAQIPELVERGRIRVRAFFRRLEGQLESSQFIAGDQFSIADISAYIAVDFAARLKMPIDDSQPNLSRWFDAVSQRPSTEA